MTKGIIIPILVVLSCAASGATRLSVKFLKQERELSCEAAALAMVLNYQKVPVTEAEIIQKMPFDKTIKNDGIWGDPDEGFVGDIDGKMGETGYGIHWNPLAKVASHWKKTVVLESKSVTDLAKHLDEGRPVIIWMVTGEKRKELNWKTPKGRSVFALMNEHTQVVYGYEGKSTAPKSFYVMDPKEGPIVLRASEFAKNWDSFGRKGIVVYR